MFNFFKNLNKNKSYKDSDIFTKTASLLIHAAKIDQNYTYKEKEIIKKTIIELGANYKDINSLMNIAEKNEENSNQILDFTKEIKNADESFKKKIIESLWTIIYSDSESDMYESNLMRRLSGLLYLDSKTVGTLKEKIKSKMTK